MHPLTIVLFALSWFFDFFAELSLAFLTAALHEFAHLLCALILKEKCAAVAIMPYGMKLCLSPSRIAKNELLITFSGPLFNLLMLVLFLRGPFFEMNLSMLLINLLPIMPSDGARILYLALSFKSPFFAEGALRRLSLAVSLILIPLGVYQAATAGFNPSLFIIGVFIFFSTLDKRARIRLYVQGINDREMPIVAPISERRFAAPAAFKARNTLSLLSPYRFTVIDVTAPDGKISSTLTQTQLISAIRKNGAGITLFEIAKND